MRTVNSYPQQLSRLTGMSLVDVTSSGAKTTHVLRGGQYFQAAQLDALDGETELVTITIGGNDISYVGDLVFLAGRHGRGVFGWLLRHIWKGPLAPDKRNWAALQADLLAVFQEIRRRSPNARVIVATYPTILPPEGICPSLNLTAAEAAMMRQVGVRLAEITRTAALEADAEIFDLEKVSAGHHACAPEPWVQGGRKSAGTLFHPSLAGATATAKAMAQFLGRMN
ncbi:hypothetical protein GCM10010909_17980 [Acidocella aquatica]|uniref:SGNH hydrolase-type esterase domain-containing protein n=2 Tax=Acidocella aquatica TaxID=1922313 RepID=A0ABQ6A954_9PROT|nr:hypothetical protein GCM10010909_17980 [Acidocella aquatica]